MFLHELEIQKFRCFSEKRIQFSKPLTLITGANGVGKTTIIEAIHYLCYFKSFRTHIISEVIEQGSESFFLQGLFEQREQNSVDTMQHALQIGYYQKKKSIKLDQKVVTSYKQVFPFFQVITLTEDDIDLIKGYPSGRRAFMDHAVFLTDDTAFDLYRDFKNIVQNRNALLVTRNRFDQSEYEIWTQALWKSSLQIQGFRQKIITILEKAINDLLKNHFDDVYQVALKYDTKYINATESFENFMARIRHVLDQEFTFKRSLFGAHLDDLLIQIHGKKAKVFASRGQQKLISLLCKLALLTIQPSVNRVKPLLLIDDFISDFDKIRLEQLLKFLISCKNQIIITAPFCDTELQKILYKADPDVISI